MEEISFVTFQLFCPFLNNTLSLPPSADADVFCTFLPTTSLLDPFSCSHAICKKVRYPIDSSHLLRSPPLSPEGGIMEGRIPLSLPANESFLASCPSSACSGGAALSRLSRLPPFSSALRGIMGFTAWYYYAHARVPRTATPSDRRAIPLSTVKTPSTTREGAWRY